MQLQKFSNRKKTKNKNALSSQIDDKQARQRSATASKILSTNYIQDGPKVSNELSANHILKLNFILNIIRIHDSINLLTGTNRRNT